MSKSKQQAFLDDLQAVLNKHRATIDIYDQYDAWNSNAIAEVSLPDEPLFELDTYMAYDT